MTNEELGQLVGCSHSMASRLRSGQRLPSVALTLRIATKLNTPIEPLVRAHSRGGDAFARALRKAELAYERQLASAAA